jgi:hypothetical protein
MTLNISPVLSSPTLTPSAPPDLSKYDFATLDRSNPTLIACAGVPVPRGQPLFDPSGPGERNPENPISKTVVQPIGSEASRSWQRMLDGQAPNLAKNLRLGEELIAKLPAQDREGKYLVIDSHKETPRVYIVSNTDKDKGLILWAQLSVEDKTSGPILKGQEIKTPATGLRSCVTPDKRSLDELIRN